MHLGCAQTFFIFIEALVEMKDEYIYILRNITKLQCVSRDYSAAGLPGCVGSMDLVHVKWANCPTGDHNRAKGKEGYPTLAFQCLTDFNRRILAIYGPQFGSRNDKDIVEHDKKCSCHQIQSVVYQHHMEVL